MATVGDLVEYFPRDYRYETAEIPIARLLEGQLATARGEVMAVNYFAARGKPRFEATISDGNDSLALVFFHGAYLRRQIHPGLILRVKGTVRFFRDIPQMANPKWSVVDPATPAIEEGKFRPSIPPPRSLGSEAIERILADNLPEALSDIQECFPPALLQRRVLMPRCDAYRAIHQPRDLAEALAARRRLVYDELMLMQLGLAISRRQDAGRLGARSFASISSWISAIRNRFPFDLTAAQQNAVWQIIARHEKRPAHEPPAAGRRRQRQRPSSLFMPCSPPSPTDSNRRCSPPLKSWPSSIFSP